MISLKRKSVNNPDREHSIKAFLFDVMSKAAIITKKYSLKNYPIMLLGLSVLSQSKALTKIRLAYTLWVEKFFMVNNFNIY